jgi:hypothetical protein
MFAECDLLAEGIDHVGAVYLLLHAGGLHLFVVSQSGRIPVIRNAYQRSGTSIPCNPHPIGTLTLFIL